MKKIGLCLAGGGARGAYQVGVAKRLEELGILNQIQVFSGTSIGSVNATLLSIKTPDEVFQLWKEISPDEIKRTESLFSRLRSEKIKIIDNGLYTIEALKTRLLSTLDFPLLRQKEVYATLSDGGLAEESWVSLFKSGYQHFIKKKNMSVYNCLRDFDDETIINLILASCSIPIVFPSVTLGEKKFYDGGLYDNVPVQPLVNAGCDVIIVVHLHLFDHINPEKYPDVKFYEIRHKHNLGSLLKFDPNHSETLYRLGYEDAVNFFEKISLND